MSGRIAAILCMFFLWPVSCVAMGTVLIKNLAYDLHYQTMRAAIIQHQNTGNQKLLHNIQQALWNKLEHLVNHRDGLLRRCYPVAGLTIPLSMLATGLRIKKPLMEYQSFHITVGNFTRVLQLANFEKALWATSGSLLVFAQLIMYSFGYGTDDYYAEVQGDKQIERIQELLQLIDNRIEQ